MKRISKCQSWRLLKRYWASRPTPDEWMQLIRLLSTIKCAKMTPAQWRCCGPHSNLANNLFASACVSRRPTISCATFHLRGSSWPSVKSASSRACTPVQQSLSLEMVESRLHLMKMRVLPSTHAFVFGAQQRSFIGLPRLQNGQLFCRPYVVRFDDIHGGFEYTRRAQFRLVHISMISHDFLQ